MSLLIKAGPLLCLPAWLVMKQLAGESRQANCSSDQTIPDRTVRVNDIAPSTGSFHAKRLVGGSY